MDSAPGLALMIQDLLIKTVQMQPSLLDLGGGPFLLSLLIWKMTWLSLIIQPLFKCHQCDQLGI